MIRKSLAAFAASIVIAQAGLAAAAPADALRIFAIDVEGGAATLYVTPHGHAVLIDTGWPAGLGGTGPSSAQRIAAAAHAAGVTKLDDVIISHYHVDHVGGVQELMALMPIGAFVDHGPNRETLPADATPEQVAIAPVTGYPKYLAAIAGKKHIVLTPGQSLRVDDLTLTVVSGDRKTIARSLAGSSLPGAGCATAFSPEPEGGEENARSLGVLAQWGAARVLSLGDLTRNIENALVCPINRVGKVGLMFADSHGDDVSNSPTLLESVRPAAVVMNNGPAKGGDGAVIERFLALTGPEGLWQLHLGAGARRQNTATEQIANLDGADSMFTIEALIEKSGRFTLTNRRNGFSRAYGGG